MQVHYTVIIPGRGSNCYFTVILKLCITYHDMYIRLSESWKKAFLPFETDAHVKSLFTEKVEIAKRRSDCVCNVWKAQRKRIQWSFHQMHYCWKIIIEVSKGTGCFKIIGVKGRTRCTCICTCVFINMQRCAAQMQCIKKAIRCVLHSVYTVFNTHDVMYTHSDQTPRRDYLHTQILDHLFMIWIYQMGSSANHLDTMIVVGSIIHVMIQLVCWFNCKIMMTTNNRYWNCRVTHKSIPIQK